MTTTKRTNVVDDRRMEEFESFRPGGLDDLAALLDGEIGAGEYLRRIGRSVPAWMNVDALVTSREMYEIEMAVFELRAYVRQGLELAERCRRLERIGNRFESIVDNDFDAFHRLIGVTELADLGQTLGGLFPHHDNAQADEIETWWGELTHMPDVTDALDVLKAEKPSDVPPMPVE
jgi:hypothetical protein